MAKQLHRPVGELADVVDRGLSGWLFHRILRWLDYVFVLRPMLFFPVWTGFGAGVVVADQVGGSSGWSLWPDAEAAFIGVALTLLMGSSFVLNQVVDMSTDQQNRKLFLVADGYISPAAAVYETVALLVLGLTTAFTVDAAAGWLFVGIYCITAIGYSLKPFSWKDRPLAGLWANMLGAALIFAAGFAALSVPLEVAALRSLPYAAAVGAVFLFTTLPDEPGDRAVGKRTFAVAFGARRTIGVGITLEMAACALAIWQDDPVMTVPALAAAPFFIYAGLRPRLENVVRAVKFPILFLALSVCFYLPAYVLLLGATFLLSKWYYWQRFGLRYPTLEAD